MRRWINRWAMVLGAVLSCSAQALTSEEALGMAVGESDARIQALSQAVAQGDDKTAAYLQALSDDAVKVAAGKVLVLKEGTQQLYGQKDDVLAKLGVAL